MSYGDQGGRQTSSGESSTSPPHIRYFSTFTEAFRQQDRHGHIFLSPSSIISPNSIHVDPHNLHDLNKRLCSTGRDIEEKFSVESHKASSPPRFPCRAQAMAYSVGDKVPCDIVSATQSHRSSSSSKYGLRLRLPDFPANFSMIYAFELLPSISQTTGLEIFKLHIAILF